MPQEIAQTTPGSDPINTYGQRSQQQQQRTEPLGFHPQEVSQPRPTVALEHSRSYASDRPVREVEPYFAGKVSFWPI